MKTGKVCKCLLINVYILKRFINIYKLVFKKDNLKWLNIIFLIVFENSIFKV